MGYVAYEVIISPKEISKDNMSKLYEVFHSSEGILKDTIEDATSSQFIYIITHYSNRLSNLNINKLLKQDSIKYITHDDTYYTDIYLHESIRDNYKELIKLDIDKVEWENINLSEFNKHLQLSEESLKKRLKATMIKFIKMMKVRNKNMNNKRDKNGNPLKGMSLVMREVSEAGGVKQYKKKIAMDAFSGFLDNNPETTEYLADEIIMNNRRKNIKVVK